MNKTLKRIAWGAFILVAVLALGLWLWSAIGTYKAGPTALAALEPDERVRVSVDQWIVFEPIDDYSNGLIFYPGGLVEPVAYAPVLNAIAAEG